MGTIGLYNCIKVDSILTALYKKQGKQTSQRWKWKRKQKWNDLQWKDQKSSYFEKKTPAFVEAWIAEENTPGWRLSLKLIKYACDLCNMACFRFPFLFSVSVISMKSAFPNKIIRQHKPTCRLQIGHSHGSGHFWRCHLRIHGAQNVWPQLVPTGQFRASMQIVHSSWFLEPILLHIC